MREETKVINIFKYKELSAEAKEHALNKHAQFLSEDSFWHETVIDDAKEIATLFGLEVGEIYWRGFHNQGDGACIVGTYAYKIGALKAVRQHTPLDTELHEIVRRLQTVQSLQFYQLSASIEHAGHYYHENSNQIDVTHNKNSYPYDFNEDHAEELREALREYMGWVYLRLEAEWEYQTSEEAVIEAIEANDYEFTENGDIY